MSHRRPIPRLAAGLSRTEALWLLLLGVCATALILWTLGRELDRARARHALDSMDYLAGHLRLALGDQLEAWPAGVGALHGPGLVPAGPWSGELRDLDQVLAAGCFLPEDPWGHAYVVYRDPVEGPVVACGGPDGSLGTAGETGQRLLRVILGPTAAAD
ncbi:MAG: hypothetical protein ISR76_07320 [Planctomycetes bacterium]|nr:hypothetical protein [Planctomycetota bacterium]MBL7008792.1 hypothetical protein [Planctomycetota bacterium]